MIHVDAEDLSEEPVQILGGVPGVVVNSGDADTDVEKAVGPECERSPLVTAVSLAPATLGKGSGMTSRMDSAGSATLASPAETRYSAMTVALSDARV